MASIACRERNMWAGIAPTSITSYFSGGALERVAIFFGSNGFDAVVAAGVERYGPPNEDRASEVQTNAGAKLQNRTVTWVRGGNLLRITKYGSTVTTSFAHISTEEYWARAQEKDKERAKKAAKDM
jgi:hypothetical protein